MFHQLVLFARNSVSVNIIEERFFLFPATIDYSVYESYTRIIAFTTSEQVVYTEIK